MSLKSLTPGKSFSFFFVVLLGEVLAFHTIFFILVNLSSFFLLRMYGCLLEPGDMAFSRSYS